MKCLKKIDEIQRNVEDKISDMLQIKEEISMAIDQLENGEERLLLRYRYLGGDRTKNGCVEKHRASYTRFSSSKSFRAG